MRKSAARRFSGPRHPGFTLVELLIVVSIVALLIAILLPSLRKAREQAKRTVCASRLRSIGQAWHSYLIDHNGRFFQEVNANRNYGGRQGSSAMFQRPKPLNPYVKLPPVEHEKAEVFECPKDSGAGTVTPTAYVHDGTSYDTNPFLIGPNSTNFHQNPANPARRVLNDANKRLPDMLQSRISTSEAVLPLFGDYGWVQRWNYNSSIEANWHKREHFFNIAFLDAHVEFVRIRKGILIDEYYTILPFADLRADALEQQQEKL